MEKMFTVAGTSNLNGVVKFRVANDLKQRIAVLKRSGHTDINLIELPEAMTKEAAVLHLRSIGIGLDIALESEKPAKEPKAKRGKKADAEAAEATEAAPATEATEPTEAEIAERMEELRESLTADGEEFSEELLREAARRELVSPAN